MAGDTRTVWRMAAAFAAMAAVSAASLLLPDDPTAIDDNGSAAEVTTTTVKATTTTSAPDIEVIGRNRDVPSIYESSVLIPTFGCWSLASSGGVVTTTDVPCNEAHQFQTFAAQDLPPEVVDFADTDSATESLCADAFTSLVGVPQPASQFMFGYTVLDEQFWPQERAVTCFLHLPTQYLYRGNARGVGS